MNRLVPFGRVTGIFGIKGWVRVHSDTEPRERILEYSPWVLSTDGRQHTLAVMDGRPHGKTVIARLAHCTDPESAGRWVGAGISVPRDQLPPPTDDEVLWADLEGLQVVNVKGEVLGEVDHLLETGANDVLVVRDDEVERLIPWLRDQVIRQVDLDAGRLLVDWEADF